jgi:4-amino-4-deoxy-L-arabinose transferase-like glycosyltransferase
MTQIKTQYILYYSRGEGGNKLLSKLNMKKSAINIVPLFVIITGVALVAFSIGPLQNWDTQLEFEAASNVAKTGFPFVQSYGAAIDEPPLGFYIEGFVLRLLGLSTNSGVAVVTFFGLGSIVLIYLVGKELYGKSTGIIAAAILGLNPWLLVLSRSFLIDSQCLFFSLLCFYVGVLAIRKGSVKLALATGLVFAAALLTKLYAAFVLIPLLLFFIYSRPSQPKRILGQLASFSLPVIIFAFLWYQIILGKTLLFILHHNDFMYSVPTQITPSPFFVTNFLTNYGLGIFIIAATAFTLFLNLMLRRFFSKTFVFDLIFLVSIIFVLGVNITLGAVLDLNVPFFSAIKYDFQALPFFVLLAATLVAKASLMFKLAKTTTHLKTVGLYLAGVVAAFLIFASLISSIYYVNVDSSRDYLQYRVEPQVDYGYALLNPKPLVASSPLMVLQYLGFAIVLFGLFYVGRHRVLTLGRTLKGFISSGHRIVNTTSRSETMPDQSSPPQSTHPRVLLNKWRLAFLVFAVMYSAILLLTLMHYPMEWDEVIHLNGALYLISGHFSTYINNAFYPPLLDLVTTGSYSIFGVSLFSARLVSVVFSVLSLWVVFEIAYQMYRGKVALLSAVLLGIMPGYFWLSRIALLETMLLFFFALALLFFVFWLKNKRDKYVFFSGLAIGLGVLTKYQMVLAFVVIAVSILFLARDHLKRALSRFALLFATSIAVVSPWIIVAYQVYANKIFSQWLYALQVGNPNKFAYSDRYPAPIFYFIDIVWPYNTVHPISIFIYLISITGLGFLALRHSRFDKFVLIWFVSTFVFFTLITNKEWRYVLPLFPTLAIATAALILFGYCKLKTWREKASINKQRQRKIIAGLFIAVVAAAMAYSVYDAYSITSYFDITIEVEPATIYALNHMQNNQSIMVLGPFNFLSQDMVKFYLSKNGNNQIETYQYPTLPVDAYTPEFNISELINQCRQYNVKFLFTYEYGGTVPYYNTTLNLQQIYQQLYESGNFSQISNQATFGVNPRRIIILTFLG